jgi:xanthine dehydrogenase YagS FAD-binding subunit
MLTRQHHITGGEKYGSGSHRTSRCDYPEYHSAKTVDEAVGLLKEYGGRATVLAGGLDTVALIKSRIIRPHALINIKPIENLKYMAKLNDSISLGATVRIKDIEQAPLVRQMASMLAKAASAIGSPHVRNMATVAGNLCQQTRCCYFRRTPDTGISFQCHRKGLDGVCHARQGDNQYHGLDGDSPCVSAFPSDLAVALTALDAGVRIVGPHGRRYCPVETLYTDVGLKIDPDEMITAVEIPFRTGCTQNFIKFRVRPTIDFAIVSVAVSYKREGGMIRDARIILGGVAADPCRAGEAENIVNGGRLTRAVAEKAGRHAAWKLRPLSQNAYKIQLVETLVKRALLEI